MVGVLGLGSNATLHFIKRLNEVYQEKNGGYSTFPCLIWNTDFARINPHLPDRFEILKPLVLEEIEKFCQMGISRLALPNITIHETIDMLVGDYDCDLIHPLKLAQEKSKNLIIQKVLILGTRFTMESNYVHSFFQNYHCVDLNESVKETIDSIRKEVYEKGFSLELKNQLLKCIEHNSDDNTLVVISCTELSILKIEKENCLDLLELMVYESIK